MQSDYDRRFSIGNILLGPQVHYAQLQADQKAQAQKMNAMTQLQGEIADSRPSLNPSTYRFGALNPNKNPFEQSGF